MVSENTDRALNQPPPLAGVNLFSSDPALAALVESLPLAVLDDLALHGEQWGTPETLELGRIANHALPLLRNWDAGGNRLDLVEFHPAFHALMRRSIAGALHCSVWDATGEEGKVRAVTRAARLYMTAQAEAGHLTAITSTNAAVAALAHAPSLTDSWLPRIRTRRYDSSQRPLADKAGALIGFGLTEKQGGSDMAASTTAAVDGGDGLWRLAGHKWFLSAPTADAFLMLAQTDAGLGCFLVPRYGSDGALNGLRLLRFKDKLGLRSTPAAEVEMAGSTAWLVGEPGKGLATIEDMVTLTRLDGALVSAGLMRMALAEAVHHARHRKAFGKTLVEQPVMTRVLADMALEAVAAAALCFRLAESYDRAHDDPEEAAFARLMTPAVKYWVGKVAPAMIGEAMECLGGSGAVEEMRMPRLYRDASINALADGAGNMMALEVLRVVRKSSDPLEVVLSDIENAVGSTAKATLNVLRAATAVALADEGSARILTEQLATAVAAATLRRRFPSVVADAFFETRLGKSWRSTYGMLDSRFDARGFVNYLCPAG